MSFSLVKLFKARPDHTVHSPRRIDPRVREHPGVSFSGESCTHCGHEFEDINDELLRICGRCEKCCDDEHAARCTKEEG